MEQDIEKLKQEVAELKRVLETHTHSGNDGSMYIYQDSIKQKTQQYYQIGNFAMTEFSGILEGETSAIIRGFHVVGTDEVGGDGIDNAQLTLEHQPSTDGSSNQTFYYGLRGRIYSGFKGKIESAGNTMYQKEFEFEPSSLVGLYVNYKLSNGLTESYSIIANDKNSITIDGTWSTTQAEGSFFIFIPIYFGAAEYPWRRLYF